MDPVKWEPQWERYNPGILKKDTEETTQCEACLKISKQHMSVTENLPVIQQVLNYLHPY